MNHSESHIIGWHGTTKEAGENIKSANFNISTGMEQWLGNGIYFFIEGIGNPFEIAKKWALKKNRALSELVILETPLCIDQEMIWDLTNDDMLDAFNEMLDYLIKTLMESTKYESYRKINARELKAIMSDIEGYFINLVILGFNNENLINESAIKGDFQIQDRITNFNAVKKHFCIPFALYTENSNKVTPNRRSYNCTVLSIWNLSCILHSEIKQHQIVQIL